MEVAAAVAAHDLELAVDGFDEIGRGKKPAHIFGEGTLLGDERARISIVAEDEVRADVIDGVAIRELIAARPDFATRLFRSVASALVERMSRLAERAAPPFP